jgi:hypothetical protein
MMFALFAVAGIVMAAEVHIIVGLLIIFSSLVLWGFACIQTDIAELTASLGV